jgi:hypothetical protein
MPFRFSRSVSVAELGQVGVSHRKRSALILSVPVLSLLLPGLAVAVASAGGSGELTRVAAAVAKFLLFYSGVFALVGLTAAVGAGLLATDRIVLKPEARILSQTLHRTTSLIGISALANHIMLEILASRAGIADGIIPFMAARSTFFMGLGTISSDLFVLVILTGVLRRRFTGGSRPALWRGLHLTAYVAWPMAILHGLLAGRSAKPYVDWSYGACMAAAALALIARYVMAHRGRNPATGIQAAGATSSWPSMAGPSALALAQPPRPTAPARAIPAATRPNPPPRPVSGPLRALPRPDRGPAGPWPQPTRWVAAPRTEPQLAHWDDRNVGEDGWAAENNWAPDQGGWAPDQGEWAPDQGEWAPDQGEWAPDQGGWAPDQGGWAPDQGGWAPDQGEWAPDQGGWAPDEGQWGARPEHWDYQ